jgi:uncharacterized protein YbaP (TraB family)
LAVKGSTELPMKALFAALLGASLATSASAAPYVEAKAEAKGAPDTEIAAEPAPAIVQDYEPEPAIWLLSDDDTKIYLLGTIHVLPEGFRWRSPRLDGIVADADELVVETTDVGPEGEDNALPALLGSLGKRPSVSSRLSPANRPKWLAMGESLGMPPEYFDRLPPLLAIIGMGTSLSQEETRSEYEFGVETVLEAEFLAAGKPIGSIENTGDVLSSLLTLDETLVIKQLDRDLSRWGGKTTDTLFPAAPVKPSNGPALADEHAWAQGREMDVRNQFFEGTVLDHVMGKHLLDNRNRAWAAWLARRLDSPGTVLLAVGAGHLAGDNSLQEMLSRRGLTAVRLN